MRAITRKCSICKEPIYINDTNEDFFITLKNKTKSYTHTNCYIKKQTTKKRSPKTIEECQEYIEQCRQNTKVTEKRKSTKSELYEFLFCFHISNKSSGGTGLFKFFIVPLYTESIFI